MKHLIVFSVCLPLLAFGQVGNTYRNYLHSEFADFFHTSELKNTPYRKGVLREIKTGGFQDFITLYLYTDTVSTNIHEATLEIDREWMEGETTSGLSADLVKSFLLDFIPTSDQPKAMAAGELLFNHKATKDAFALNLAGVFRNEKDSMLQRFPNTLITAGNYKEDNRILFRLKISEPQ